MTFADSLGLWAATVRGATCADAPGAMSLCCVDTSAWHHAANPEVANRWLAAPVARIEIDGETFARACQVQGELAHLGGLHHRSVKIADLIIAAASELSGTVLWHYDEDYDRVAAITGQRVEWIVPRGTLEPEAHHEADGSRTTRLLSTSTKRPHDPRAL